MAATARLVAAWPCAGFPVMVDSRDVKTRSLVSLERTAFGGQEESTSSSDTQKE